MHSGGLASPLGRPSAILMACWMMACGSSDELGGATAGSGGTTGNGGSGGHAGTAGGAGFVCSPNAQQSCQTGNGTGTRTCNGSGSTWSACGNITSCDADYTLYEGACHASQQPCTIAHGTGVQTFSDGGYGACCVAVSCNAGYILDSGACYPYGSTPPTIEACPNSPGSSCASLVANGWQASRRVACGHHLVSDGQPGNGNISRMSLRTCTRTTIRTSRSFLFSTCQTQAWLRGCSPASGYDIYGTYFDYITDPGGNKYPFVAPGAHYLNQASYASGGKDTGPWDFLCLFDPA